MVFNAITPVFLKKLRLAVFFCILALFAAHLAPAQAAPYSAMVFDAHSGEVIYEHDQHLYRHPASLTKMMTLYMVFDKVKKEEWKWDRKIKVSKRAAGQPPSKLGLRKGDTITVKDAAMALITRSANDMATALAEAHSDTEVKFAQAMTQKAKSLGMSRSTFRNASGLPARGQLTTARDMGVLAQSLIRDFPDYYKMFNTESYVYRGQKLDNHNKLLGAYPGIDGIKTGYIRASGFNLVASAERGGKRLIGVVIGGKTSAWRDRQMQELLDYGFDRIGIGKAYAAYPVMKTTETASSSDVAGIPPIAQANLAQGSSPVTPAADSAPGKIPEWQLQVGAYKNQKQAVKIAKAAQKTSPHLLHADIKVTPIAVGKKKLYRARLSSLYSEQAEAACDNLKKKKWDCKIIPPDNAS